MTLVGTKRRRVLALLALLVGCGGEVAGQIARDASTEDSPEGPVDATAIAPDSSTDSGTDGGPDVQDAASDVAADAPVVVSDAGCPPDGNVTVVTFASNPSLTTDGGSVVINATTADPNCGEIPVIVVHTPQGGYAAFPDRCTFECCDLLFDGTDLFCACHTFHAFDLDGDVLDGQSTAPLRVLPTCWDSTAVYVSP